MDNYNSELEQYKELVKQVLNEIEAWNDALVKIDMEYKNELEQ